MPLTINHVKNDLLLTALSRLPTELWLQVLEQVNDVEFLWCTVRLVSRDYKSYVERMFVTSFLPTISLSLSLPRMDPSTGVLRHARPVPGSQVFFHCRNIDMEQSQITLATPEKLRTGDRVEDLTASGTLSKQRLDEAEGWMWFGHQIGKGVSFAVAKDIQWDNEAKVWIWALEWKELLRKFVGAKRASRRPQREKTRSNVRDQRDDQRRRNGRAKG